MSASLERQPRWRVGDPSLPRIFVSIASKGLSPAASLLFATLARKTIHAAAKGLTRTECWRESNWAGGEDFEGPRGGGAWFAGHGRIVPTYKGIITVPYVNDYL